MRGVKKLLYRKEFFDVVSNATNIAYSLGFKLFDIDVLNDIKQSSFSKEELETTAIILDATKNDENDKIIYFNKELQYLLNAEEVELLLTLFLAEYYSYDDNEEIIDNNGNSIIGKPKIMYMDMGIIQDIKDKKDFYDEKVEKFICILKEKELL